MTPPQPKFICNSPTPLGLSITGVASMDRRRFIKTAAATTVMTSLSKKFAHAADAPVPKRTLGGPGEKGASIGVGGYHLGVPDEPESLRIIRAALDNEVNFLDNCWDYNDGQ